MRYPSKARTAFEIRDPAACFTLVDETSREGIQYGILTRGSTEIPGIRLFAGGRDVFIPVYCTEGCKCPLCYSPLYTPLCGECGAELDLPRRGIMTFDLCEECALEALMELRR